MTDCPHQASAFQRCFSGSAWGGNYFIAQGKFRLGGEKLAQRDTVWHNSHTGRCPGTHCLYAFTPGKGSGPTNPVVHTRAFSTGPLFVLVPAAKQSSAGAVTSDSLLTGLWGWPEAQHSHGWLMKNSPSRGLKQSRGGWGKRIVQTSHASLCQLFRRGRSVGCCFLSYNLHHFSPGAGNLTENFHTCLNDVGALRTCWHSWGGTDEQTFSLQHSAAPLLVSVRSISMCCHVPPVCTSDSMHGVCFTYRSGGSGILASDSTAWGLNPHSSPRSEHWKMGAGDLDLWKCYFESNKTWSSSLVTLTVPQRILLHPAAPWSSHWMQCFWGSNHCGVWWHNNSDKSHSAYSANSLSTKINILVCLKKIIICN